MPVFQPSNQIKLTNVSVVRLKRGGKRFEVACYKNKVREWRNGIESDLSEVIQTDQIFTNVSKGQLASESDLLIGFPKYYENSNNNANSSKSNNHHSNQSNSKSTNSTSNSKKQNKNSKRDDNNELFGGGGNQNEINHKILMEILKNGELQVSDKERQEQLNEKRKEILNLVSEKTLDPNTNRPHTISMIEKSMEMVHFSINLSKPSKIQALELIKILIEKNDIISICRNQMRIRLTISNSNSKLKTNTNEPKTDDDVSLKDEENEKVDEPEDEEESDDFSNSKRSNSSKKKPSNNNNNKKVKNNNKLDKTNKVQNNKDKLKEEINENEDEILNLLNEIESDEIDETNNLRQIIGLIDPSQLKSINSFIQTFNNNGNNGKIKLETLSLSAQQIIQDDHHH